MLPGFHIEDPLQFADIRHFIILVINSQNEAAVPLFGIRANRLFDGRHRALIGRGEMLHVGTGD